MHPEQRWMIKYLIVSTALAIVGATIAVTDPPFEKIGKLAARLASPGWTAVTRLAPTVQTVETQVAGAAFPEYTDAPEITPDVGAVETPAQCLAQAPTAPAQSVPLPPPPAFATPVPEMPVLPVPLRAIALPVMARTIGFIEAPPAEGQRYRAIRASQASVVRLRSGNACAPAR